MALLPRALTSVIAGQARAISKDQEPFGQSHRTVLRFRVEDFDDDGDLTSRTAVEMRGLSFEGSLAEGDTIRLTGRHRNGTVRTGRVENLTTDSMVVARGQPVVLTVLGALIAFGVLIIALYVLAKAFGLF